MKLIKVKYFVSEFMFYDVDFLFQQLLKRGNESMNLLTVGAAEAYLTRDVYLYTSTVSCEYHANVESTVSKLNEQVKRYRYLLLMNKKTILYHLHFRNVLEPLLQDMLI